VADDQRVADRGIEQRAIERQQRRDALVRAARPGVNLGVGRAQPQRGRITRRVEQSLPAQVFGGCARLVQGPGLLPPGEV
jgi:hypothetical protein